MVIYKTTNLVNGKQYIGRDGRNNPNYLGSGILLQRAIKKYGKENFKKEILEECNSDEILSKREEYWLNYYDAGNNPNFYNMHNYSHGGASPSIQTRQKTSMSLLGRKISDEHRKKISAGRIGIVFSEDTRKKMSLSHFGKVASEETKIKMSKSRMGELNHWYGKKLSEDHRKKLSESHMGNVSNFKGYVICVCGQYKGQRKTSKEWSEIIGVSLSIVSRHLSGKRCKNGIKGNLLKWEHEI
jgi:group I intron endonuclease